MTRFEFREAVYFLCVILECSETSGFRTQARNTKVGGKPKSKHRKALAVDVVPDRNSPERRRAVCDAADRLGIGSLDEGDHVHLQVRS
jgi:uncharacterized protein YcbK (DUF882 family)